MKRFEMDSFKGSTMCGSILTARLQRGWHRAVLVLAAALALCAAESLAVAQAARADAKPKDVWAPAMWSADDAAHLLRRAGFSGTPEQIAKLHAMGMEGAVDYLLTGKLPAGMPEDAAPFEKDNLDQAHADADPKVDAKGDGTVKVRQRAIAQLSAEDVERMVSTGRPLEEKMVLFWHGLFTSGLAEVKSVNQLVVQDRIFRDNAMGNYKTITQQIVRDPAMLKYLNNNENVKGKPNENLARELCELFTMGEGKGYTEKDVAEIARALTGAGVQAQANSLDGKYVFNAGKHDAGPKTIFGSTGNYGPDDVVELIFQKPEPAEYMAMRLLVFFAHPNPTREEIAPIATSLRATGYQIAPALRLMFTSPSFYGERSKFSLIKSPASLVVGTIRIADLELETPSERTAAYRSIALMGQQFYRPPNVRGWPGGEDWITAATLFERYNTATGLIQGQLTPPAKKKNRGKARSRRAEGDPVSCRVLFPALPDRPTPAQVVAAAVSRFLQRPLHPEKIKVLEGELAGEPIVFGQPQSEARVRQVIGLLLSTPEYQVE